MATTTAEDDLLDVGQPLHDQQFRRNLERARKRLVPFLPPGDDPTRLFAAVTALARADQKLYSCTLASILGGLVRTVQTGLELGVTCFLVPTRNVKAQRTDAVWIAHYKGLIELAYDSGAVASIHAEVVREGDTFGVEGGSRPRIKHSKLPFGDGAIMGAYAVAVMARRNVNLHAVMGRDDIEAIRREFSKQWAPHKVPHLPAWYAKKTAIRQLCNQQLPLSRRLRLALSYDAGEAPLLTHEEFQAEPLGPAETEVPPLALGSGVPAAVPIPRPVSGPIGELVPTDVATGGRRDRGRVSPPF